MNVPEREHFCTFCHTIVPKSEINESIEELLLVLFIEKISDKVVACPCCLRKLTEFCEFKLLCLVGEEKLYLYQETEYETLNLDKLFLKIYGPSRCRFCKVQTGLSQIRRLPYCLNQYDIAEIIQKHFFEINITEVHSGVMCKSCTDIISDFKSFVNGSEILSTLNLSITRPNGLSNDMGISGGISEVVIGVFFECQYCGRRKTSRDSYDRHIRLRHKECTMSSYVPLVYKCYLCDIKKEHEADLVQHIKSEHMTSKLRQPKAHKRDNDCTENQGKCSFLECHLCGEKKVNKAGLIYHIRYTHFKHRYHWTNKYRGKPKTKDRSDRVHVENREKIKSMPQNPTYLCPFCDMKTRSKPALGIHIKFKHKMFECYLCGIKKYNKKALVLHIRTHNRRNRKHSKKAAKEKMERLKITENMDLQQDVTTEHQHEINNAVSLTPNMNCSVLIKKWHGQLRASGKEVTEIEQTDHSKNHKIAEKVEASKIRKKVYTCSICGKTTRYQIAWWNHMRSKHANNMKQHVDLPKNCVSLKHKIKQSNKKTLIVKNHINRKALIKVIRGEKRVFFECKACGFKSLKKNDLVKHVRFNHMRYAIGRGRPRCTICGFLCNKLDLLIHMRVAHNMTARYEGAELIIDKINDASFECYLCGTREKNKDGLILHIKEYHDMERHNIKGRKRIQSDVEVLKKNNHTNVEIADAMKQYIDSTKPLEMPITGIKPSLETSTGLEPIREATSDPNITHNSNLIDLQQITANRDNAGGKLTENVTSESKKPFWKCKFCDVKLKKTALMRHIKIQHSVRFECPICKFKSKRKIALLNHLKYIHKKNAYFNGEALVMSDIINDRLFECNFCGVKRKTQSTLQSHITRYHLNGCITKKPIFIESEQGSKCCTNKESSKTNKKVLFECTICDVRRKNKSSLLKHMTLSHAVIEDSVFKCILCSFQTLWRNGLTNHLKFKHNKGIDLLNFKKSDTSGNDYLECYLCATIKTSRLKMIHHFESRHQDMYGQETNNDHFFKCCFCGTKTKRKDALLHHIESKHQNTSQNFKSKTIDESKSESKTFICTSCNTEHENEASLLKHVCQLAQVFICNLCGAEHDEDKQCVEEDVVIHCDICNGEHHEGKCEADFLCDIKYTDLASKCRVILCSSCGTAHENYKSFLKCVCKFEIFLCEICGEGHEPGPDVCGRYREKDLCGKFDNVAEHSDDPKASLFQQSDENRESHEDESKLTYLCHSCGEEHDDETSLLGHVCTHLEVFFCQSCGTEHKENEHCEKQPQSINEKEDQEVDSVLLPRSFCDKNQESESQRNYTQDHIAKVNMSCDLSADSTEIFINGINNCNNEFET